MSQSQLTSMARAMLSACSMELLAKRVGLLHVDGAEGLIDGEDDGEPHRRLRRRQHDDEDGEDLAGHLAGAFDIMVEGDEVDVGGIQDERDAHEAAPRVASAERRPPEARGARW